MVFIADHVVQSDGNFIEADRHRGNYVVSSTVCRMSLSEAEKNLLSAQCVNEGRVRTVMILFSHPLAGHRLIVAYCSSLLHRT